MCLFLNIKHKFKNLFILLLTCSSYIYRQFASSLYSIVVLTLGFSKNLK